jgi:hypothetical protein
MSGFISRPKLQPKLTKTLAIVFLVVALVSGFRSLAQVSSDAPSDAPQPPSAISPNDLANLIAPIALYPDALLGQVLVACTYPLELVEAQQWLQQNPNLHNRELIAAAQLQNWDPSVQALAAFPDVVALLNRNIRWTTDLGNAFLSQQSDVMDAIQTLRAQAQGNGQLGSNPQLSVNTESQGDQSAIEIQPANPQTMYVPSYNPSVVWGAPAEGSYPALPYAGNGFGSLFGTVANLAGLLPGFTGLLGPKSWGWALSWLAQALFVNNSFFSDFGFHNFNGSSFSANSSGSGLWVHNPHHRLGVPYGSSLLASRYGAAGTLSRPAGDGWRTFRHGSPIPSQSFQRDNRTANNRGTFGTTTRTPSSGSSGRALSQPPRTARTGDRSLASSHNAFANPGATPGRSPGNNRSPEPSRTAKSSSWRHALHFSKARVSSPHDSSSEHGMSQHGMSRRSFSQHAPKEKHFSAPKFKAPHAPKSHGGGHSSHGHSSGGKSHRR